MAHRPCLRESVTRLVGARRGSSFYLAGSIGLWLDIGLCSGICHLHGGAALTGIGAFFIAGTFALAPFDKTVAGALQKPGSQANRLFQNLATGVRLIADPGSIIIGTSMYAVEALGELGIKLPEMLAVNWVEDTNVVFTPVAEPFQKTWSPEMKFAPLTVMLKV